MEWVEHHLGKKMKDDTDIDFRRRSVRGVCGMSTTCARKRVAKLKRRRNVHLVNRRFSRHAGIARGFVHDTRRAMASHEEIA